MIARTTARLVLRGFTDADREPFAALNADPRVMAHYPATLTRAESDAQIERILGTWREYGYGLWALQRRVDGAFLGYAGLAPVPADVPAGADVEVGWRLAFEHWGRGYASEAARASLGHAFDVLGVARVASFTAETNERSRRVMQRLGMRPAGRFEHPRLPAGHPLRRHVLFHADAP